MMQHPSPMGRRREARQPGDPATLRRYASKQLCKETSTKRQGDSHRWFFVEDMHGPGSTVKQGEEQCQTTLRELYTAYSSRTGTEVPAWELAGECSPQVESCLGHCTASFQEQDVRSSSKTSESSPSGGSR